MIIMPKLFNLYSRLDRPTWQQWKDRRLRLLRFVNNPAFWGLPEDRELIALAGGPQLMTGIMQGAAGAMAPAGGSTLALTSLSSDQIGLTSPISAGVRFLRGGDVQEVSANNPITWTTQNTATEWIAAAEETASIGDDHQCKVDESLTSNYTFSTGWSDNTYIAISTTRTVSLVSFGVEIQGSGTAYVRETANTSNEVSASIFMRAESLGGGILC